MSRIEMAQLQSFTMTYALRVIVRSIDFIAFVVIIENIINMYLFETFLSCLLWNLLHLI